MKDECQPKFHGPVSPTLNTLEKRRNSATLSLYTHETAGTVSPLLYIHTRDDEERCHPLSAHRRKGEIVPFSLYTTGEWRDSITPFLHSTVEKVGCREGYQQKGPHTTVEDATDKCTPRRNVAQRYIPLLKTRVR